MLNQVNFMTLLAGEFSKEKKSFIKKLEFNAEKMKSLVMNHVELKENFQQMVQVEKHIGNTDRFKMLFDMYVLNDAELEKEYRSVVLGGLGKIVGDLVKQGLCGESSWA